MTAYLMVNNAWQYAVHLLIGRTAKFSMEWLISSGIVLKEHLWGHEPVSSRNVEIERVITKLLRFG